MVTSRRHRRDTPGVPRCPLPLSTRPRESCVVPKRWRSLFSNPTFKTDTSLPLTGKIFTTYTTRRKDTTFYPGWVLRRYTFAFLVFLETGTSVLEWNRNRETGWSTHWDWFLDWPVRYILFHWHDLPQNSREWLLVTIERIKTTSVS